MSLGEDGNVLLSSSFDKYIPPSLDLLDAENVNSESLFTDDFSFAADDNMGQTKDQLSLLMRDLDFDLDLLEGNSDEKQLPNDLEIGDFTFGNEGERCSFSHSSPVSSDSGNHSPSSTSSEGIHFGEVWQDTTLRCEAVSDIEVISTNDADSNYVIENERPVQPVTLISPTNTVKVDECSLANAPCVVPVQFGTGQVIARPQQSLIYILPASSSRAPQNICLKPAPSTPLRTLVEKPAVHKTSGCFVASSNRMQPYSTNRPHLIIPKLEAEPLNAIPIIAKPLVSSVPITTTTTLLTPVAVPKTETTFDSSYGKIILPVANSTTTLEIGHMKGGRMRDAEEYARKREERKIKNRASAQQSRIRKRHELDELKQKLAEREMRIQRLQLENEELKKRLQMAQNENATFKKNLVGFRGRSGAVTGAAACLMVVFLMVTFSGNPKIEPIDDTSFDGKQDVESMKLVNAFHGRSLLSVDYDEEQDAKSPKARMKRELSNDLGGRPGTGEDSVSLLGHNASNYVDCGKDGKVYLNQTERIRVNNDLSNWVGRHERLNFLQMRSVFRAPVQKLQQYTNRSGSVPNPMKPKAKKSEKVQNLRRTASTKKEEARLKATRERAWRHLDLISATGKPAGDSHTSRLNNMDAELFGDHRRQIPLRPSTREMERIRPSNAETQYSELARAIKQREDTLYVVTMKDYYLLPATNRNSTDRPRVSLILPAFSYNGTLPHQVAMMRIDCEVSGTGLFHISDSLLLYFYNQTYYNQ